jgi:predicted nucleic acid-binding protein
VFLIDTNVISEARKGRRANPGVRNFFAENADEPRLYITVQTVGELRCGVDRIRARGDDMQADRLESWLSSLLAEYSDKILDFDAETAQVWGRLMATSNQHPIDKQIAAIALIHNLTVVTRNVDDFAASGATLLNPFA